MIDSAQSRMLVPVIGDFQIGKSTLVNCLVEEKVASMGKKRLATTKEVNTYPLDDFVAVCDTPGADDPEPGIVEKTEMALTSATAIVFVASGKIRKTIHEWLSKTSIIPCIFIYNCMDEDCWNPQSCDISEICSDIEREELEPSGHLARCIPVKGRYVWPVNILWGLFGVGLLDDEQAVEKIRSSASLDLGISVESMSETEFRAELWNRSGIEPLRKVLHNLPLQLLKHAAAHPELEIDRIVNRFAEEFRRRWSAA